MRGIDFLRLLASARYMRSQTESLVEFGDSEPNVSSSTPVIAVVIPCYKVLRQVLNVIIGIGPEVSRIYVVDDACPDGSGSHVEKNCADPRVRIIRHKHNLGVGGAVISGYRAAINDGARVIVKIDGDGQMDPALIPYFIDPILSGEADYAKGNRFFDLEAVRAMPHVRLAGNAVLSLMTKLSSGYWNLFDPTNGYTAIHADVAKHLPFAKISNRYFFETDLLFRLNVLRAVVVDVPMEARYENEISNLRISRVVGEFLFKHVRNFFKRIFYNYYLRDLSLASIELPVGLLMICFGIGFGCYHWLDSARAGVVTPAGTVMLAAIPLLMGVQFVLSFLGYDIAAVPNRPVHRKRTLATSRR
jgi:dolichol-phosphate mannosyltransferase